MSSVNISLPDSLRVFVERRTQEQGYGTVSDYFCDLILKDQQRQGEARLETLLLEGLNIDDPIQVRPEYMGAKLQRLVEQHTRRREPQ
jgi:antitoxin ParD1/3/4